MIISVWRCKREKHLVYLSWWQWYHLIVALSGKFLFNTCEKKTYIEELFWKVYTSYISSFIFATIVFFTQATPAAFDCQEYCFLLAKAFQAMLFYFINTIQTHTLVGSWTHDFTIHLDLKRAYKGRSDVSSKYIHFCTMIHMTILVIQILVAHSLAPLPPPNKRKRKERKAVWLPCSDCKILNIEPSYIDPHDIGLHKFFDV